MIKAIFFDIDGTLLSHSLCAIPASAQNALQVLRKKGLKLFIATGRCASEIHFLYDLFPFTFDGYITMNGQYCYCESGVVYEQPICKKDLLGAINFFKQNFNIPCSFAQKHRVLFNEGAKLENRLWSGIGKNTKPIILPDLSELLQYDIYQISPILPKNEEEQLLSCMPHCKSVRWHQEFTDIIPASGGKTSGIEQMLAYFGFNFSETMAFGDGGNDIEMLKCAKIGVAMGNSAEEVKKSADYVTRHIDQDGIVHALQHYHIL